MSKENINATCLDLEVTLEKINHLMEHFISGYGLDSTGEMEQYQMMVFASNRDSMGMDAQIISDYVVKAIDSFAALRGGAAV